MSDKDAAITVSPTADPVARSTIPIAQTRELPSLFPRLVTMVPAIKSGMGPKMYGPIPRNIRRAVP